MTSLTQTSRCSVEFASFMHTFQHSGNVICAVWTPPPVQNGPPKKSELVSISCALDDGVNACLQLPADHCISAWLVHETMMLQVFWVPTQHMWLHFAIKRPTSVLLFPASASNRHWSCIDIFILQTGWGKWGQVFAESRISAVLTLASTCFVVFLAATAGSEQWSYFLKMFDESRFEHVTILDFSSLVLLAPYWVLQDATQREWNDRCVCIHYYELSTASGPRCHEGVCQHSRANSARILHHRQNSQARVDEGVSHLRWMWLTASAWLDHRITAILLLSCAVKTVPCGAATAIFLTSLGGLLCRGPSIPVWPLAFFPFLGPGEDICMNIFCVWLCPVAK